MELFGKLLIVFLCAKVGFVTADDTDKQVVASANNKFAINLYKKITNGKDNLVSSPFSVSAVLSMLLVGARGRTADQMKSVLEYHNLNQDQVNAGYKQIIPALAGNYTLVLTNAIFVNKDIKMQQEFLRDLESFYHFGAYELDVANGQQQINDFVNERTRGKIPKLLENRLPSDTEMVLVNAIYFKGAWKTKFNKALSKSEAFTNEDGSATITTLMHSMSYYKYLDSKTLKSQVLLLPYTGGSIYMIFLLPLDKSRPLSDTESLLTGNVIEFAFNEATRKKVVVTIPKFKIESFLDLNQPLMDSGMKLAFSTFANFSGISDKTVIKVNSVVQKTMIEVSEEGTLAAAATSVHLTRAIDSVAHSPEPILFTANRPFLFAVYNIPTKSALFIGRYVSAKF